MKKSTTITINDKIITINEITVRQMITLKDTFSSTSIIDALQGFLPLLTDASPDFLLDLAPSELETLYDKIKEVNGSFLKVLPLDKILTGYRDTVLETLTKSLSTLSAPSLQQVTA